MASPDLDQSPAILFVYIQTDNLSILTVFGAIYGEGNIETSIL